MGQGVSHPLYYCAVYVNIKYVFRARYESLTSAYLTQSFLPDAVFPTSGT